ncbi:hypothetical protein [Halorubrum sp. DM2]|uniref:HVO_A0114 family putative DNA-binding protein n=1 Tax=Halorubrum sp. DM2 TaxID=2527867 RepID=UPI0024B79DBF|nr:hypothetical protein [Halorubrum sp. DM2]
MTDDSTTAERDGVEYPEVLRVEVGSTEEMFADAIATAEAFETGETESRGVTEAVLTFESIGQLWKVFTARRIELLESLLAAPTEGITQLAERVDQPYAVVHEDVEVLVNAGIIKWREAETTSQLFAPYDRVEIGIVLSPGRAGDSQDPSR